MTRKYKSPSCRVFTFLLCKWGLFSKIFCPPFFQKGPTHRFVHCYLLWLLLLSTGYSRCWQSERSHTAVRLGLKICNTMTDNRACFGKDTQIVQQLSQTNIGLLFGNACQKWCINLSNFILFLTKPAAASLGIHINDRVSLMAGLTKGSEITATDLKARTSHFE